MATVLPKLATAFATVPIAVSSLSLSDNTTATAGCQIPNSQKRDCGHMGTNQPQCEAAGCCWVPTLEGENGGIPWCFFHDGPSPPPGPPGPSPPAPPAPAHCDVKNVDKLDCGHSGSSQTTCEASGCCWKPATDSEGMNLTGTPWCYYNSLHPNPCKGVKGHWKADSPGFTDAFYALMQTNFEHNLNVDGVGAVVASRDKNTPGGSYFYHWMRDGALSMKGFIEINDNDYDKIAEKMRSYVKWVSKVQNEPDPHGQSVFTEPKFMIPAGNVYPGGWCRPQTDGPGLRATTLTIWGEVLAAKGMNDEVVNTIFPLIENDMGWVLSSWSKTGCDLWEEVRSNNFFWGQMSFVNALTKASALALKVGKHALVPKYNAMAATIRTSLDAHWNAEDQYLWESKNRPIDGAVIHAIATFGNSKTKYPVTSKEAAKTIMFEHQAFCKEYPINQKDDTAGVPGLLIGRYPHDSYAGGNPWQLLTAVLAEAFYLASKGFAAHLRGEVDAAVTAEDTSAWCELLDVSSASEIPKAAFQAGDAVMYRMYKYVGGDGGRIDEQMSKTTGAQKSAKGLTWSYANLLHALHVRKGAKQDLEAIVV